MSASTNTRLIRQVSVGAVVGLIIGILIGLLIGWVLWPVQYKEAYTYQLVDQQKEQYVAAVADSYNLTKQVGVAQQRFEGWTTEEKVSALAQLFAVDQAQGKMQEAERVAELAAELQRVEGWDPTIVNHVLSQMASTYVEQGEGDKAQAVSLFAGALGSSVAPSPVSASTPVTSGSQAQIPIVGNVATLLGLCGFLLLLLVFFLAVLILRRGGLGRQAAVQRTDAEPAVAGPAPLLRKTSSYTLGMDNFDESFAIETEDSEWLGECGMGISESLNGGTPRRVVAFEVWLFDKPNTRTITKVLMSDFAYNNETLRNKLASRGDPVLATSGGAFTLETPALTVQAQITEIANGEDTPAFGYFNNLSVALTVYRKPEANTSNGTPTLPRIGASQ
ncbi:MAG: hypothetical protein P8186_11870 [Anaerolineae bacterium]